MEHLFSESASWQTISEFVSPDGGIIKARGKSIITISDEEVCNESWVKIGELKKVNSYKISPLSDSEYRYESFNPDLGKQLGIMNADRNILYSKFVIEDTSFNGYEIIRREDNICYALGALYNGNTLVNTWTATMIREK